MCVALDARPSTKHVDGWFTEPQVVRAAARIRRVFVPENYLLRA